MEVPQDADIYLLRDLGALLVIIVFSILGTGTIVYELRGYLTNLLNTLRKKKTT